MCVDYCSFLLSSVKRISPFPIPLVSFNYSVFALWMQAIVLKIQFIVYWRVWKKLPDTIWFALCSKAFQKNIVYLHKLPRLSWWLITAALPAEIPPRDVYVLASFYNNSRFKRLRSWKLIFVLKQARLEHHESHIFQSDFYFFTRQRKTTMLRQQFPGSKEILWNDSLTINIFCVVFFFFIA